MKTMSEIEVASNWETASTKKMISHSFGFVIFSYLSSVFALSVFYFYEVEIGLPINLLGISFVIYAIWSMINYPLLGYLTDRPIPLMKKWGMRSPWIMISAFLSVIFFYLIYTPPIYDAKTNPWPIFWYMLIMTCLFDTFFTIFNEHFVGGFVNQFREDSERRRASGINMIFSGITLFFMGFIWPLTVIYGDRSTFVLAALIAMLILIVCIIIIIPGISESEEAKARYLKGRMEEKTTSFWKMMKQIFRQKNFRSSLIAGILGGIAGALGLASGIYFMKDVLRLPLYFSIFTSMAYFISFFVAMPFWLNFIRKHGHVKTYILGLFLAGFSLIPYLWITTLEEIIILSFVRGAVDCSTAIVILMIISDVYDETTLLTGKHQEATLLGIRLFFVRTSVIFQAIIITWIHIATGYNPDPHAVQSATAVWGIRVHAALIPMICIFLSGLVMLFFYDLKGEKQKALKKKLRERGL